MGKLSSMPTYTQLRVSKEEENETGNILEVIIARIFSNLMESVNIYISKKTNRFQVE